MFPLQAENAKCPAWALMISALRTSLQSSSVCWEQSWGHWGGQGAQGVASDITAPRFMLMAQQQGAQWGGDRPAQGMPGPLLQLLTATCVQGHVPASSEPPCLAADSQQMPSASNSVPWGTSQSPCPGCCASEHVCWWQPVLQSLGTGPAGHFGDKSIMGTPSTVGSLIFHNKPNILPPNPATLHHKLSAKVVVSGIISGGTGVRCGGKKAQVRRDIVACLAPASTALCCSCWSCSTLCSGLQKTNCREFMIFYYIWKEWHVRKILMCLCLDRQESRRTNYNINICSGRITNRNRAD